VQKVVGLGAGGHAKVMIEALRATGSYEIAGLLDPNQELWNLTVLGVKVLGGDALLPELRRQGINQAFIGLGGADDAGPRRRLYQQALDQGFKIVSAVHPQATISPSAVTGHGFTIFAGAVVNAEARLGDNVTVNTGAIVEHDCQIGDHVHIATGSRLCSTVRVGSGAHIGAGATVRQNISIGEDSIVGAGAVVVKDVDPWTVVVGVPARLHRQLAATGLEAETIGRDQ
jgi:sugar O-acyltransferase (sialic acid O-acetyltransferase NeuD family)